MNVEIFTLCDAAADYQARLSILGVFDTIFASQLPATHPHCSVALRMNFSRSERGDHRLTLHIVDEDGTPVIPEINATVNVEVPGNTQQATVNLVVNLVQLRFSRYGEHAINLAIDGREEARLSFWIRERPTT